MNENKTNSAAWDARQEHRHAVLVAVLVVILLAGLPLSVWLDLRHLTDATLNREASDLNSLITSVRGYYADNVVNRILSAHVMTQVSENYAKIPGAIPIPATLSLELGQVISVRQANISYRFVSDYPFKNRAPHTLDAFEQKALSALRQNANQMLTEMSGSILKDRIRLVAPIIMAEACVNCHNTHPDSPKTDWKVGDVRGIQEISVAEPLVGNIWSFKYLLIYFVVAGAIGSAFILLQRRQAAAITGMNRELATANDFLASVSTKISRYLSPQIYRSIFTGETDVTIHTARKKLTIFFSDIKDFTATTERLQPEEITALLNQYLTEMSSIALKHGGTIDKFVGDAMLIFFGDPESKGTAEDARACVRMAIDMQRRIAELNMEWRTQGSEQPFYVRMGINTGYCNVGNFGSAERMDYTIIGAEANLAARLQSIAEPGRIVLSYETYALARGLVAAHPLPPIFVKGISHEIVPFILDSVLDSSGSAIRIFSEHAAGMNFYLDPRLLDSTEAERVRKVLSDAVAALDQGGPSKTGQALA